MHSGASVKAKVFTKPLFSTINGQASVQILTFSFSFGEAFHLCPDGGISLAIHNCQLTYRFSKKLTHFYVFGSFGTPERSLVRPMIPEG